MVDTCPYRNYHASISQANSNHWDGHGLGKKHLLLMSAPVPSKFTIVYALSTEQ